MGGWLAGAVPSSGAVEEVVGSPDLAAGVGGLDAAQLPRLEQGQAHDVDVDVAVDDDDVTEEAVQVDP